MYPGLHAYPETVRSFIDQSYVDLPDEDGGGTQYHITKFDRETYKITSWSAESIDAVLVPAVADPCRAVSLNLDFAAEEFFQIARNTIANARFWIR